MQFSSLHSLIRRLLILTPLILLASCAASGIRVAPELQNSADVFQVSGRNNISWKSALTFGEYSVRETKKTFPWQTATELEFLNGSSAGQKFNLELHNRNNRATAELVGRHELKTQGVNFRSVLPTSDTLTLKADDNFFGAIRTTHSQQRWQYQIANISTSSYRIAEGSLYRSGNEITMKEITELDGAVRPGPRGEAQFYGLEFYVQGNPVAAVQYHDGGKIWLSQGLSDEYRDVISALSSAIILKQKN